MPHFRKRHLSPPFEKLVAHSRIVGILGHRQVGKTTFLEANSNDYCTLDEQSIYKDAKKDPALFISKLKGNLSGIDECQLVPALFPALKLRVQKNQKPGQFILSGSVRFTSRKAIRESLTGRISNLEMFPMVLTELDSEPLSNFFPELISCGNLAAFLTRRQTMDSVLIRRRKTIQKYLEQGGLPGICFIREKATRNRILRDLLMTILDRDLRLVYSTSVPYSQIVELCQAIAEKPLSAIRWSDLHKKTGLAEKTLRNLLQALEAVFLLRPIPIEGGGSQGSIYLFEDQIEDLFFNQQESDVFAAWVGLIYRNIRAQFEYRLGFTPHYFHFLTRAKTMIPLGLKSMNDVIGIFPVGSRKDIGRAQLAAAGSFLKHYEHSKVIFVSFDGMEAEVIDARSAIVPVEIALY